MESRSCGHSSLLTSILLDFDQLLKGVPFQTWIAGTLFWTCSWVKSPLKLYFDIISGGRKLIICRISVILWFYWILTKSWSRVGKNRFSWFWTRKSKKSQIMGKNVKTLFLTKLLIILKKNTNFDKLWKFWNF